MNNQGEVTDKWGDGTHTFRLTVSGAIELEQKCDAPFAVIFNRLVTGGFSVNDVRETIRIGLIGGGMLPSKALTLVDRYTMPLAESLPLAKAIVAGVMFGFEASPLGEDVAAPKAENPSPPASTLPSSPELPTSLESVLASWDASAFGNTMPV